MTTTTTTTPTIGAPVPRSLLSRLRDGNPSLLPTLVAVALFVNGIALLSAVTATIAAKVLDYDDETGEDTEVGLGDLHHRLANIERQLSQLVDLTSSATKAAEDDDAAALADRPPASP